MCVSNVINSVSTVQNIFSKWKWFSCFPKSQSEIEMDRWWFDLTLTFWRNEKWNDLAKIFSCCVINMHTHSVHIVRISSQGNIIVNGMTKVNDVQAKVKVKSLQSKLFFFVIVFFFYFSVYQPRLRNSSARSFNSLALLFTVFFIISAASSASLSSSSWPSLTL